MHGAHGDHPKNGASVFDIRRASADFSALPTEALNRDHPIRSAAWSPTISNRLFNWAVLHRHTSPRDQGLSERTSSMSTRARRSDGRTSGVSRGPPSSPGSEHLNLTVKRARFEDEPQQYMKLSDEVQAKKVFTAEELSMRRAEMARRRRNLSDKRNEEVKASIIIMETINKLLKKQAPKTKGKGANGEDTPGGDSSKPDVAFVRWVNSKKGSIVAVPEEIIGGPTGKVFGPPGLKSGKMVEEVA
ncbi:papa-1-like conserved region family protein [Colletotrichum scovillei]|nr:papa-1-like conserved region family protein [Colletotrichum scovillei]